MSLSFLKRRTLLFNFVDSPTTFITLQTKNTIWIASFLTFKLKFLLYYAVYNKST